MEERTKNGLYILVAGGVTILAMATNLWLVWGVVISLMVLESLVSNLESWADERGRRYVEMMQKSHAGSTGDAETLLSIQTSLAGIEERLDALEKQRTQ